ncbi:hypothetical protein RvY_04280, partial [Ramazzottius varieornatus]
MLSIKRSFFFLVGKKLVPDEQCSKEILVTKHYLLEFFGVRGYVLKGKLWC